MLQISDSSTFFFGVIENRDDPTQMGRVQVRVIGVHPFKRIQDDVDGIPVEDLPWMSTLASTESASIDGIGSPVTGLLPGSHVFGFWLDKYKTNGIVAGSVNGYFAEIPNPDEGFSDPSGSYPSSTGSTVNSLNIGGTLGASSDVNANQDGSSVIGINPGGKGFGPPADGLYSTSLLSQILKQEEGRKNKIYQDRSGWSIGIGHLCLHTGSKAQAISNLNSQLGRSTGGTITSAEIDKLFSQDLAKVKASISTRSNVAAAYRAANGPRRIAIEAMVFQMGIGGVAGFTTTLSLMASGKWEEAAQTVLHSKWARQTAARATRTARVIKYGNLTPYGIPNEVTKTKTVSNQLMSFSTASFSTASSFVPIETKDIEVEYDNDDIVDLDDLDDVIQPSIPTYKQPERLVDSDGILTGASDDFWSSEPEELGNALFQQAPSNYRGQYPYVKTKVSEGGTIEEIDDTPGNERYRKTYASGGYTEINSNGTMTNKSSGDMYNMAEQDISLYSGRDMKTNIGGNEIYYNLGNRQKQIDGNSDMTVMGNDTTTISGNKTVTVEGDEVLEVSGSGTIKVSGNITIICESDLSINVSGNTNINTSGNVDHVVGGNYNLRASGIVSIDGSEIQLG